MNKSEFINPKNCMKCGGKCCKTFSIFYPKSLEKDDPIQFSEVRRFHLLDRKEIITTIEHKLSFEVRFNIPCAFFLNNKCSIYEGNRPELCKQYPYIDTLDCPYHSKEVD